VCYTWSSNDIAFCSKNKQLRWTRVEFKYEFILQKTSDASVFYSYSLSGDRIYLATYIIIINVVIKNCNVSFGTVENQTAKYFSSCLMLAIRYHLNSYYNMLLPYLTAVTVQCYWEIPITTFPAIRKPNSCAFQCQTPCFLYIEFTIIFVIISICYFHWRIFT
jgi:hypothetical protein